MLKANHTRHACLKSQRRQPMERAKRDGPDDKTQAVGCQFGLANAPLDNPAIESEPGNFRFSHQSASCTRHLESSICLSFTAITSNRVCCKKNEAPPQGEPYCPLRGLLLAFCDPNILPRLPVEKYQERSKSKPFKRHVLSTDI